MSLEDDNTSTLPELTPISSNQHVKKSIQNSALTTVDSSVNVSLKTLIEQQASMSSNIDKLTNTFCNQLTSLTSILTHNVNVEQTSSGSTSSQEKSLVVKTRHKETRKRNHHYVSSSEDSNDSDGNDTPTHKSPKVNSHHS